MPGPVTRRPAGSKQQVHKQDLVPGGGGTGVAEGCGRRQSSHPVLVPRPSTQQPPPPPLTHTLFTLFFSSHPFSSSLYQSPSDHLCPFPHPLIILVLSVTPSSLLSPPSSLPCFPLPLTHTPYTPVLQAILPPSPLNHHHLFTHSLPARRLFKCVKKPLTTEPVCECMISYDTVHQH